MTNKKNTEVENLNERKFRIIEVKEITGKNGNKFTAFKTVGKGGKKMDVRFVRNCTNVPTEPCTIVVNEADANVDTSRLYPILWIKDVIRIEENERKSNLDDFFGDDGSAEGEPF